MEIKRFEPSHADEVSAMIIKTLRITNIKDYSAEYIDKLTKEFLPERILERSGQLHYYVACKNDRIVGCGAIGPDAELFNIFVMPDAQGQGIGEKLIKTLEQDEFALRSGELELHSSITALQFYIKLGYTYKNGVTEPDENGLVTLIKTI